MSYAHAGLRVGPSSALAAALALLAATSLSAQTLAPEHAVDAIFAAHDTPDSAGCAVSVMQRGAIVYTRGYGMANLEYGVPITPASIFHVASVSKQFTAMAVALLAAEGKVSWDDDIRRYVPEVPDYGQVITLRQLAQHTSGLRDQWELLLMAGWRWEADVVRQEDVLNIISRQRALNFAPGSEWLYSNTGYTLLAVVVERVSGMTLREFAEARIFAPLGMTRTHFHDDHQMIVKGRAYAYAPDSLMGLKISIPDFAIVGASSLFTTVEDLALWERNFHSARVGGPDVVELLQTVGTYSDGREHDYGYGLGRASYRGLPTVSHGGADAGYRAHFLRFPRQDFAVAVLCNFPHSAPWERAQRVADIYLADHFTEPARAEDEAADAVEVSERELRRLEGVYIAAHSDIPEIVRLIDGKLMMSRSSRRWLVPLGEGRFRLADSETVVEFTGAGSDEGLAMKVPAGTVEHVFARTAAADTAAESLRPYLGNYYSFELGTGYSVKLDQKGLYLLHWKHGRIPLTATHEDGFSTQFYAVTFKRDTDGQVVGFSLSSPRVRRVAFERQP